MQGTDTENPQHGKPQRETQKDGRTQEKQLNKKKAENSPTKEQMREEQSKAVQQIKKTAEVLSNNNWRVLAAEEESSGKVDSDSDLGVGEEELPKVTPISSEII